MGGFDEVVDRLTHRLRIDPELHMDVAAELRTHLEEAEAEFVESGRSPEQAASDAVRALGDVDQLADMLWQANRRRIRLRGVAKWAARVTLLPAALAATALLGLGMPGTLREVGWMLSGFAPTVQAGIPQGIRRRMTPEQRFLFEGDPQARTPLERARSIADRFPDDPVCYGYYVACYMSRPGVAGAGALAETPAVLRRGERIDPDNAFHNVLKAAVLFETSSRQTTDERVFETVDPRGQPATKRGMTRVEVTDPERFAEALAEVGKALPKPRCTSRAIDMSVRQAEALPVGSRLRDRLLYVSHLAGALMAGTAEVRRVCRTLGARAVAQAEAGRSDEARELVRQAELLGAKYGADAQCLLELLVGQAARWSAIECSALAFAASDRPDEAAAAREVLRADKKFFHELRTSDRPMDEQLFRGAGILHRMLLPAVPGYRPELEPMRSAERALASQYVLSAVLALLVLGALVAGAVTLVNLVRLRGRPDRPKLLIVACTVARLVAGAARIMRLPAGLAHFRRTAVRSVVPVLAALVIVAAVGMGTILVRQETAAVGRMTGAASFDFRNEIELSDYRVVRARLRAAHRETLGRGGRRPG